MLDLTEATVSQSCTIGLFQIDFDSGQTASSIVIAENDEKAAHERQSYQHFKCSFRYMSPESVRVAKQMVEGLGQALGYKIAFAYADACVADMFESLSRRIEGGFSQFGAGQVSWLQEWASMPLIVEHVSF